MKRPLSAASGAWLATFAVMVSASAMSSAQPPAATSAPSLEVVAAINRPAVDVGVELTVWLSVYNGAPTAIAALRCEAIESDAFDVQRSSGEVATLEPGDRLVYTIVLRAGDQAGSATLAGTCRASAESGPVSSDLWTRKVEIRPGPRARRLEVGLRWAKDLALPIVVLLLGLLFRLSQSRRDENLQILKEMIQVSQRNAEKYYLPISSALLRLRLDLEDLDRDPARRDSARETLFLDLLRLLRRDTELTRSIGGFYFKNREGEHVAAHAWFFLVRHGTEAAMQRSDIRRVVEGLEVHDGVPIIAWKLATHPPIRAVGQRLRNDFVRWAETDLDRYACVLHALEIVLDYEMNLPFEKWYGRKEKFETKAFEGALRQIETWRGELDRQSPRAVELDKFFQRARRYLRRMRMRRLPIVGRLLVR